MKFAGNQFLIGHNQSILIIYNIFNILNSGIHNRDTIKKDT